MRSKTTFVEQGTQVARNGEEKQQVDYFRPKALCLPPRWPHKSLLTSKRLSAKLFAWNTLLPLESRRYPITNWNLHGTLKAASPTNCWETPGDGSGASNSKDF